MTDGKMTPKDWIEARTNVGSILAASVIMMAPVAIALDVGWRRSLAICFVFFMASNKFGWGK